MALRLVRRGDALVLDADVGLLHAVHAIIVRRASSGSYLHGQQLLALLLQRTQNKLRQGRDALFDEAADHLGNQAVEYGCLSERLEHIFVHYQISDFIHL